jgi:hypothetical protein
LQTLVSAARHGIAPSLAAMPLIVITHVFYGLGFWRGLFTRLGAGATQPRIEVALEHVRL